MSIFPVVIFPDAELTVVEYLRDALDDRDLDVPVVTRVPRPRPDTFVVVERVGGVRTLPSVEQPRIDLQAWGPDNPDGPEDAMVLGQLVHGLLHAMPGVVPTSVEDVVVTRVIDVAGPYRSPDPESNQPRVRLTVEIGVHGHTELIGS